MISEEGYKNIIKTYEIETNQLYQDISKLEDRIDKAINHLNLFIEDTNLSKYDTLKILMHTKKILKGEPNNE